MGLAHHVVEVLIPTVGIALFAAPGLVGFDTASVDTIALALVAATIARVGASLAIRVRAERSPLRIGLIGGSDLGCTLAFQLKESRVDACQVVGYIAVAVVALPLVGLLAMVVKLWDGGPVFYRHRQSAAAPASG